MKLLKISDLPFIAKTGKGIETLSSSLVDTGISVWKPDSPHLFSKEYRKTKSCFDRTPELGKLIDLNLVTTFLLSHGASGSWKRQWLIETMDMAFWFAPLPPEQVFSSRWSCARIILIGDRKPAFRYIIAGLVHEPGHVVAWPEWADAVMDSRFKEGVRKAAEAVFRLRNESEDLGFYCYPLAAPTNCIQFKGNSLGLPMSLCFQSLLEGCAVPEGIISTGAVETNGAVRSVQFIQEKAAAACKSFNVFMYPSGNAPGPKDIIISLPVDKIGQAWMLMKLYSPPNTGKLRLFLDMSRNPDLLIRNLDTVPVEWLKWAATLGHLKNVIQGIRNDPALFSRLTDRFEAAVLNSRNDFAAVVSSFISLTDDFPFIRKTASLSAFRWAVYNLSMWNHRGRRSEAEKWAEIVDMMLSDVLRADIFIVADYFNHLFVLLHNQYRFSPELPQRLERILQLLEKQYSHQCDIGCDVFMPLGRIYGSISQNFGFCGSEFIDMTIQFSGKARKALGEHTVPEYKHEWIRQYNYLTYALLEAGTDYREEARVVLFKYLEIDDWNDLSMKLGSLSKWEHALTARFMADAGEYDLYPEYQKYTTENPDFAGDDHPWQLWA